MVVLWVLLAVLTLVLFVVALSAVALSVPVALRVSSAPVGECAPVPTARRVDAGPTSAQGAVRTEVVWLFGAVRVRLDGRGPRRRKSTQQDRGRRAGKKKRDEESRRGYRRLPPGGARDLLSLVRPVLATLGRVIRRFQIVGAGDLALGLPDPADTGRLWGQWYPFFARVTFTTGVRIHPAFDGPTVRLTGAIAIRTIPVTLTLPVLRFLVSREGRTMVRLIRRSR